MVRRGVRGTRTWSFDILGRLVGAFWKSHHRNNQKGGELRARSAYISIYLIYVYIYITYIHTVCLTTESCRLFHLRQPGH